MADVDIESQTGLPKRQISPRWFLAFSGIWVGTVVALGVVVAASEFRPQYYETMDICFVLSLVAATISIVAHKHFEMSLVVMAIVLNTCAFITAIGGCRIAVAEIRGCRKLYDSEMSLSTLQEEQARRLTGDITGINVHERNAVVSAFDIETYGSQCMRIYYHDSVSYNGHLFLLVMTCLATTICSTVLTAMLVVHIPGITAHAKTLEKYIAHIAKTVLNKKG